MNTDVERWLDFAHSLGIEIVAPFLLELDGVQMHFTALLPQFGAPAGMVVDADCDVLWPHRKELLAAGYGLSCVGPCEPADDVADGNEMLSDWGWSSASPKPNWLRD